MTIGHKIATIRKSKKMTQKKLSVLASVDYNTLRKIETGKTKNPSYEFLQQIADALSVPFESLISIQKPNIQGSSSLPLLGLSPEEFETLILWIVKEHPNFDKTTVQHYAGRGDKQRDVIAKRNVDDGSFEKYTLFQAKRYQSIDFSTLKTELGGIKKHFFDQDNLVTPIDRIVFCIASTVSASVKDKTKDFALKNNLPEPIFWDAALLNALCEPNKAIMNKFFGGHAEEIKAKIETLQEQTETNKEDVIREIQKGRQIEKKNQDILRDINAKVISVTSADDAEMQRARRLIAEREYRSAKEILLILKEKIENSNDTVRLKKLYNNLGLCFSKSADSDEINKGIEYLNKALDIDNNFGIPKSNLIQIFLNNGIEDKYPRALDLAKELYDSELQNLEYLALYIHALHANSKKDDAKKHLSEFDDLEEKISKSESLCVASILIYFDPEKGDMNKAIELVDIGLKHFSDSVPLNRLKGSALMYEAEKSGFDHLGADALPIFKNLKLVSDAVSYFDKALSLSKEGEWSPFMLNQIKLYRYNTLALLNKGRVKELSHLENLEKEIKEHLLSEDEKRNKLLVDISIKLFQKNFIEAYKLSQKFIEIYNCAYKEVKKIASNFLQHASPEYSIKILAPLIDEAKENEDFEYWALLSQCYILLGDKNSALRIMNEAKSFFSSRDSKIYNKLLSHYGALAARYRDNSESDRLVKSLMELQEKLPDESIMVPVKAIEDDGSLSDEIKNFFETAKANFEQKRELFKTNAVPVYFLTIDGMFNRSFPEVTELPRSNYDFEFVLPYNALDENFVTKVQNNFQKADIFVLDYSALLNFARTEQLGIFDALGKKVVASEHLLDTVQRDLIISENPSLRVAWNFLRSDAIELFTHRDVSSDSLPEKMKTFFEEKIDCLWLTQEIDYCVKEDAVLVTDDLRLLNYLYSSEVSGKAVNSFIFFQESFNLGLLDKKQYSSVLGELADFFYHFIPFNGEDLLNIILDDSMKIESQKIGWRSFKNKIGEFKISRRAYHLLNQVRLPGSEFVSFLVVSLDFLRRLTNLGVLEEEKIQWVLFLTNFYSDIVYEDKLKSQPDLIKLFLEFVVNSWILLVKLLPSDSIGDILKSAEEIKNNDLRFKILKSLEWIQN